MPNSVELLCLEAKVYRWRSSSAISSTAAIVAAVYCGGRERSDEKWVLLLLGGEYWVAGEDDMAWPLLLLLLGYGRGTVGRHVRRRKMVLHVEKLWPVL